MQLVDGIRPAAEFSWQTQGAPGEDGGPYIFFEQLFAVFIEVLLWLPPAPRRDELLRIGLFEGRDPAWLKRAKPFVGRRAAAWLRPNDIWSFSGRWANYPPRVEAQESEPPPHS